MPESLVSIILPVYNVENYLRRAIQSARQQTYSAIEIILVDDGSTDLSGDICDQESNLDERIIAVHQENAGLSGARNTGIAVAKGKYLFFLDADDSIALETIAMMVQVMEEKQCDLVVCGMVSKYVNEGGIVYHEKSMVLSREGFYQPIELFRCFRSDDENEKNSVETSCGKLYKRSMFVNDGMLFSVHMKLCEDCYFLMDFLQKCQRIYYIKKELYHYYRYNAHIRQTLMNSYNGNRFKVYKELYLKLCNLMNQMGSETDVSRCRHNFADKVILACIILCRTDAPYSDMEIKEKLKDIVCDESVIEAMPHYQRKVNKSWTVPLLIKKKKVDDLFYFARKIARRRYDQ